MNIVFLTTEDTHHYYLINEIHKFHSVKKVFYQTKHIKHKDLGKRFRRVIDPRRLRFTIRSLLVKLLFNKEIVLRRKYENKMFFNNAVPYLNPEIPTEKIFSFNIPEEVEKVRKEKPDLIIVFGTEVLKGEILEVASLDILNIHRNILPKYRGGGLPSWIFYNKDFDNLGTTIHLCAEKLDAGDIVSQKFYSLKRDDRIYTLRYKTTLIALEILKETIEKYKDGSIEYNKQEPSKLWTSKNMTIFKEIIARRNFNNYIKNL
ncbi:MAG: hypothetical protein AMJ43_07250 [Coxiella sp. DG_40]|nr:MAG: hypothetical protein AMJ43_07250 [Coxiella sp. DG_40]